MWSEEYKGKARFFERYEDPMTGKLHRVSCILDKDTKKNRKLAQEILADKIREKTYSSSAPEEMPLKELVELYRAYQKSAVRESTYQRNYHACESLMRILGEDTLVSRLSAGYINQKFLDTGDGPGTLNERTARLKALIRWGYNNDHVPDISYLSKLKTYEDKQKKEKLEDKFLEKEDANKLIAAMKEVHWNCAARLCLLSGMRIGEALALTRSDVDYQNRYIHITKTRDGVNKLINDPKTYDSIRDVYMQKELIDLCHEIDRKVDAFKRATGIRSDLFMPGVNGDYLEYYAYNKYLVETSEAVLGRRITTHVMRHTHVALMAEAGASLPAISRRLGHKDSDITEKIYFHVTKKMKEKDNSEFENISLML